MAAVARKAIAGEFGDLPEWRLMLLLSGIGKEVVSAKVTAYSSRCPDGGGPRTRWGTRVRRGICAADPRHWGPGSVLWFGPPVEQMVMVEDTGGAIKGRHRFDISLGTNTAACRRFGVRRVSYIPLYQAPPSRNWGTKPKGWIPAVPPLLQALMPFVPAAAIGKDSTTVASLTMLPLDLTDSRRR